MHVVVTSMSTAHRLDLLILNSELLTGSGLSCLNSHVKCIPCEILFQTISPTLIFMQLNTLAVQSSDPTSHTGDIGVNQQRLAPPLDDFLLRIHHHRQRTSTMAEEGSRFLELPAEIRCSIYEYAIEISVHGYAKYIIIGSYAFGRSRILLPSLAITQVSRLIRQKSVPIFYQDVRAMIYTCDRYDRANADRWGKELIDSAVLGSITSYTLRPLHQCFCRIWVDLNDKEQPVKLLTNHDKRRELCSIVASCAAEFQDMVERSVTADNGRYVMSAEMMKDAVKRMCAISEDVDREEVLGN